MVVAHLKAWQETLLSHALLPAIKIHALVCFLSASVLSAADSALPSFSEKLFDRSELSVSEALKSGKSPAFDPEAKVAAEGFRRTSPGQKRLVSRMPIIEPSADVDPNMPVGAPRSDIDLKMVVKEPDVDSAKSESSNPLLEPLPHSGGREG
ncbi:MAG TPA: hypothetical protein VMM36_12995 [Opitutaceae bacterium]|nr:hypothetical protein [Opitutaceae bacterium]